MQSKTKTKIKKMKAIILTYRVVSIVLVIMLMCSVIALNNKKRPVVVTKKIVKNEVVNPNTVMLGDSITDYYNLDKFYGTDVKMVNSGISGNVTTDILSNLKNRVYVYNPSKVFLLIGINDIIVRGTSPQEVVNNIDKIVAEIKGKLPDTTIYIESIYPINSDWKRKYYNGRIEPEEINLLVRETNMLLKQYCKDNDFKYINVYSSLVDDSYSLISDYSDDGLHLNDSGYEVVTEILKKYM